MNKNTLLIAALLLLGASASASAKVYCSKPEYGGSIYGCGYCNGKDECLNGTAPSGDCVWNQSQGKCMGSQKTNSSGQPAAPNASGPKNAGATAKDGAKTGKPAAAKKPGLSN